MNEPTFPGPKPQISVYTRRLVIVRGLKVRVELEPGCWVRGSRLGLMARHPVAGSARLTSRKTFDRATDADLDAMIRRLKVVPCKLRGCRRPNLVGDGKPLGNEKGYCARHRLKDILDAAAVIQKKLDAERAKADAAKKAKGFRYKATIWIHRDDRSDTSVWLYFVKRPTAAAVRKEAARRRSRIVDDFSIERL